MKGEERFGSESWIEGEILKERENEKEREREKGREKWKDGERKNSGQRVKKEGKKVSDIEKGEDGKIVEVAPCLLN